ncbi:MAG: hypothetical protein WKF92_13120 [Pyrinomonadaceae bacterium]
MANINSTNNDANAGEDPPRITGLTWIMAAVFAVIIIVGALVLTGVLNSSSNDGTGSPTGTSTGRPAAP